MAYITKTTGVYFYHDLTPLEGRYPYQHSDKWHWVFFHPKWNPEHQHVALFLHVNDFVHDAYHFGVDKAKQFLQIKGDSLKGVRIIDKFDPIYILIEIGELADGQEPDGYGSCGIQRWYTFSKKEYQQMKDEFKKGLNEMGWG